MELFACSRGQGESRPSLSRPASLATAESARAEPLCCSSACKRSHFSRFISLSLVSGALRSSQSLVIPILAVPPWQASKGLRLSPPQIAHCQVPYADPVASQRVLRNADCLSIRLPTHCKKWSLRMIACKSTIRARSYGNPSA